MSPRVDAGLRIVGGLMIVVCILGVLISEDQEWLVLGGVGLLMIAGSIGSNGGPRR